MEVSRPLSRLVLVSHFSLAKLMRYYHRPPSSEKVSALGQVDLPPSRSQLCAHPGDHLENDPGRGLLQHGDRQRVRDVLQAVAVHGEQAITASVGAEKTGEIVGNKEVLKRAKSTGYLSANRGGC